MDRQKKREKIKTKIKIRTETLREKERNADATHAFFWQDDAKSLLNGLLLKQKVHLQWTVSFFSVNFKVEERRDERGKENVLRIHVSTYATRVVPVGRPSVVDNSLLADSRGKAASSWTRSLYGTLTVNFV